MKAVGIAERAVELRGDQLPTVDLPAPDTPITTTAVTPFDRLSHHFMTLRMIFSESRYPLFGIMRYFGS